MVDESFSSPLVTAFRNQLKTVIPDHFKHASEFLRSQGDQSRAKVSFMNQASQLGTDKNGEQEDAQFKEALRKFYELQSHPPSVPSPVPLKMPNSAQLLAGGLTALLMPKFAATAIASPFQAALAERDEDHQKAVLESENAMRAWQAQVGAAGDALGAMQRREHGVAVPPLPSFEPALQDSVVPEESENRARQSTQSVRNRLLMNDFETAKEISAKAQAGLKGVRRNWISPDVAAQIEQNESTADGLRAIANNSSRNLPMVGPLQPALLEAQRQRNESAWTATRIVLGDIERQIAAVNDRLNLIGQGHGSEEVRRGLFDALDWLEAQQTEKMAYLQRLAGTIHRLAKRQ